MTTKRAVVACLGALVWFALTTQSARAGDTDCADPLTCGFGAPVASAVGPLLGSGGGFVASFTETVYLNTGTGVFTYVYDISNTAGATLHSGSTGSGIGPALVDLFNPALNYGIVTSLTTPGVDDGGFSFFPQDLFVLFSGITPGTSLTFYAQSTLGPGAGMLGVFNSTSSANSPAFDPFLAGASEPTLASLLGTSLVFMLGVPFVGSLRRQHQA